MNTYLRRIYRAMTEVLTRYGVVFVLCAIVAKTQKNQLIDNTHKKVHRLPKTEALKQQHIYDDW